ncbi:MAG TPA: DUF533 domain-containing protein [Thermodesulfobacteriota bacterium]|nr:DUF533 domain-containing protein [Thermodesulfobacteriota bacterium]
MKGFRPGELENFLKVVFAIAWADGFIQKEESVLLREMIDEYDLSAKLKKEVLGWFVNPVSLESIDWKPLGEEAKAFIFLSAWRMATADSNLGKTEAHFLLNLQKKLDLPEATLSKIKKENKISIDFIG